MTRRNIWFGFAGLAAIVGVALVVRSALSEGANPVPSTLTPTAVEVVPVEQGVIERRQLFTGTLEAAAEFVVAPKVGGRIERIDVDLADVVERGQVVAHIEDAEYRQAVAQAHAELSVARAQRAAAHKAGEIAQRAFERVKQLRAQGVASDHELDQATAARLEAQADVEVADAQVQRARAAHEAARIRQQYTRVTADWPQGDAQRIVAARHADEGETVAQHAPLLTIVDLDPVTAVVFATERDYADLRVGQPITFTTDAYPGESFEGQVARIAPVFRTQSRQARVELSAPNPDGRLRPGMFVRAQAVLEHVDDAVIVPEDAIVSRDDRDVVFVVPDGEARVLLVPVQVGIRSEGRAQVLGEGVRGRVVTLGQQHLDDGAEIRIPGLDAAQVIP